MRYIIPTALIAVYFLACKSYDLKPIGQNVKIFHKKSSIAQSISQNKSKSDSPFSKCKSLGNVQSNGGNDISKHGEYGIDQSYDNAKNDIANQSGLLGANIVFYFESGNNLIGAAYQCESLETLLSLQKTLDEEEKKLKEKEREKRIAEIYSKPHHWLLCGKNPYSRVLPSITSAALKEFKPKAFQKKDSLVCGNEAAVKNMMGESFGISCICTENEITLNRQKIEAEFGAAEIHE